MKKANGSGRKVVGRSALAKVECNDAHEERGDALSQVLGLVRLRGHVVIEGELGAFTEAVFPPGRSSFLHMRDGEVVLLPRDGEPLLLQPGDFVFSLQADGYTMRDGRCGEVRRTFKANLSARTGHQAQSVRWAINSDIVGRFLAGAFSFDVGPLGSLITGLPGLIHVKCNESQVPQWLDSFSRVLIDEATNVGPGSSILMALLIDLLVIRTLRTWINGDGNRLDSLLELTDKRIGRALNAIHRNPEQAWTVESLAEIAAMSRSNFSDRFTATVGVSPLRYVTWWRLTLAADWLRAGKLKVTEVAQAAGYGSEAAFSRAFKAQFGYPPRDSRRIARS
ncbi:AraC family transcriptional regulator [Paraburkholderia sp. SOS3]|uniref:AraC family transcriptional regulator n=1 Tax=Paraburkholderia sp. SOS3 TaxID=1926494 RepID=UPI0009F91668|nr:AraC family transcriptional regulator [Paraburkholderia sp. SOS3]